MIILCQYNIIMDIVDNYLDASVYDGFPILIDFAHLIVSHIYNIIIFMIIIGISARRTKWIFYHFIQLLSRQMYEILKIFFL